MTSAAEAAVTAAAVVTPDIPATASPDHHGHAGPSTGLPAFGAAPGSPMGTGLNCHPPLWNANSVSQHQDAPLTESEDESPR